MDIPVSFIWIAGFFEDMFKYGDSAKCWGYVGTKAELACVEFFLILYNVMSL
jgi:hypothetical protein